MWSYNVTTIEHHQGEKCKSSVERLGYPGSITFFRSSHLVWQSLGVDNADGRYEIPNAVGW